MTLSNNPAWYQPPIALFTIWEHNFHINWAAELSSLHFPRVLAFYSGPGASDAPDFRFVPAKLEANPTVAFYRIIKRRQPPQMSLINFRYKERRRTVRVSLSVPLTVHGKSGEGEKFAISTHSQSVNRHGALFHLEHLVTMGQQLLLVNDHTARSVECRVINMRRSRDGKNYVGVEFVSEDTNFWHMSFPIPGTRPLRRSNPTKQSA